MCTLLRFSPSSTGLHALESDASCAHFAVCAAEPLGNLTASLRVRLDSLPEGDLLPNEGINVTVWAQDSWSNALPQLVASKAIMYSPEIVDEGISVELPLENLLPGSTEGEQADRLVYFVELRGLQDCCRSAATTIPSMPVSPARLNLHHGTSLSPFVCPCNACALCLR